MIVYLVMQSDELKFDKPAGPSRVRGVFSTKPMAEKHIGPIEEKYIICETCGNEHSNPKADLDANYEPWRKKLFIREWTIDE